MRPEARAGKVIAVTGLALEARIAEGEGVYAIIGAGDSGKLEAMLRTRLADAACAVISFGIAGGLEQGFAAGTCVVARTIIASSERWRTDGAWSDAIADRVAGTVRADLAALDAPVLSPSAKKRLQKETGAVAVDTESHVAAKVAAQFGLPFAVFRVIADPADRALPQAAAVALRVDGRVDALAVLRSVVGAPGQISLLIRAGIDAQIALRALARGRRALGAGMGYPNFGELLVDVS